VPFYVVTELIKIDPRSVEGISREVRRDPMRVLDQSPAMAHPDLVVVECDDLEYTPRSLVTAYISEEGILPPSAVLVSASRFLN
jgi:translation initiation factor 2B subunit (eIF-2B alpha/beta/delta family)